MRVRPGRAQTSGERRKAARQQGRKAGRREGEERWKEGRKKVLLLHESASQHANRNKCSCTWESRRGLRCGADERSKAKPNYAGHVQLTIKSNQTRYSRLQLEEVLAAAGSPHNPLDHEGTMCRSSVSCLVHVEAFVWCVRACIAPCSRVRLATLA